MLHTTDPSKLAANTVNSVGAVPNNGEAIGVQRRQRQPSGLAGSIWAPLPQPSDTTWPQALDSFSRIAERDNEYIARADAHRQGSTQGPLVTREDVFGPQPAVGQTHASRQSRDVGAIGDGRKWVTPDYAENAVCLSDS